MGTLDPMASGVLPVAIGKATCYITDLEIVATVYLQSVYCLASEAKTWFCGGIKIAWSNIIIFRVFKLSYEGRCGISKAVAKVHVFPVDVSVYEIINEL